MICIQGTYFDGKRSLPHMAILETDGQYARISAEGSWIVQNIPIRLCTISPPLGKTRRYLNLPDGAKFETDDFQALITLERLLGKNKGMKLVHFLESYWRLVSACFVGLIIAVFVFTSYGIPVIAEYAAISIPEPLMETIGRKTANIFDSRFFKPSDLDEEKSGRVHAIFKRSISERDDTSGLSLELRKGGKIGANAFALPSGLIFMTDELVKLAENDLELEAVFVHEICHIEKRHGLRMVFQQTGIFLLISAIVGDVTSITSVAATLPTLLIESGYSRDFEREADEAAGLYLIKRGYGTKPYQDILMRVSRNTNRLLDNRLLSTHPRTTERVNFLKDLEKNRQLGN